MVSIEPLPEEQQRHRQNTELAHKSTTSQSYMYIIIFVPAYRPEISPLIFRDRFYSKFIRADNEKACCARRTH